MCQKYQDVPMFMHPLEPKRVCVPGLNIICLAGAVSAVNRACRRAFQQLPHTIRLYRRDSTQRSLERGLIGGDERSRGSGSNRFLPGSRWVSSKRRRADLVILQSPPRWPPSQQSQHSGADFAARLSGTDRLCFGGYRLGQLGLS